MHSWVDWLDPHKADLDYTERSNSRGNLTSRSACTFIDKASLRTASCSPTCADDGLIKVVRAHACGSGRSVLRAGSIREKGQGFARTFAARSIPSKWSTRLAAGRGGV